MAVGENGSKSSSGVPPPSKFVIRMALCACLNSALLGYDIGVLSGVLVYVRDAMNLSTFQIEILTSSMNYIAIPGCFLSSYIADSIGRVKTLFAASFSFLIGALIMAGAQNYNTLFLGRALIGIGVGCGLSIDPLYIAEMSPPEHRGWLTSFAETAINVGILLGYLSNVCLMWLPPSYNWRVMLAIGAVPPLVVMFLAAFIMPDTPRYHAKKGRDRDARRVLIRITDGDAAEADRILEEIHSAIQEEDRESDKGDGWWRVLKPNPVTRQMLILTWGVSLLQQITGVDVVLYYAPIFMEHGGIHDRLAQLGLTALAGATKLAVLFVAMHYLDHKSAGRRPLLLYSLAGTGVSLLLVSVGFVADSVGLAVFGIISFCGWFSVGMGPVCWLLNSEVLPLTIRARGMTVGCSLNRLGSAVLQTVFLSLAEKITVGGAFAMLAGVSALGFWFVHARLPETKRKSLEEMYAYFASKLTRSPTSGSGSSSDAKRRERYAATKQDEKLAGIEMKSSVEGSRQSSEQEIGEVDHGFLV